MAQTTLPAPLDIPEDQPFNKDVLDAAFAYIVQRFLLIEAFKPDYQAAIDQLNQFGLDRLNQAIQPIYDQLVEISNLGVLLTANSTSTVTVGMGTATFVISQNPQQFAPAAYLTVQSTGDTDTILTGRLLSYDKSTGILKVTVDQFSGTQGNSFNSWVITPGATPNLLATAHSVGAYTMAETDSAIATLGNSIIANAPAGRQTLKALNDLINSNITALQTINSGSTSTLNSFGQALSRFVSNEGVISSLLTQVGLRVRFDTNQGLTAPQQAQALANIGGQANLGFTPVQQGGGPGQGTNKIYIGWDGSANLKAAVDGTDIGQLLVSGGNAAGTYNSPYYMQKFPSGLMIQGGSTIVTLDSNNAGRVIFPTITIDVPSVVAVQGDNNAGGISIFAVKTTDNGSFLAIFTGGSGTAVRVNWTSYGRWQ